MKNQAGFISIILTVIITALLVGGGTYVLVQDQAEKKTEEVVEETSRYIQQQQRANIEKLAKQIEELEKEVSKKEVKDEYGDWQFYKNHDYGFYLTFPKEWEGYLVKEREDKAYGDILDFGLGQLNDMFAITRFTKLKWDEIQAEAGPKPTYVNEKDGYVFGYSRGHDVHPDLITAAKLIPSIVESFKFLDNDISEWHNYTNKDWNFAFKYPGNWKYISEKPLGIAPNYWGYSLTVGILEDNKMPVSLSVMVNPDGFGPHFPHETFMLKKSNGDLMITEEIKHEPNGGQVSGSYNIIAREDIDALSPNFWMSFVKSTDDEEEWKETVKKIISSLVFLDDDINEDLSEWSKVDLTLGFVFKYPLEFSLDQDNDDNKLFTSEDGHFRVTIYDNEEDLSVQEIKEDYYTNDMYGYQYEDTFPVIRTMKTYKQARYDLGVIERYYIPHSGKIFKLDFEFNFDTPDEDKKIEIQSLISDIMNTIGVLYQ